MLVLTAAVAASGTAAEAGPIVYEGDLTGDLGAIGVVNGGSLADPGSWDFWTFEANAGDEVTVTVLRLADDVAPILGLWFGLETDTSGFTNLFGDGATTTFLGWADGGLPGPLDDPRLTVLAPSSGRYTIAVADHGVSRPDGLPYTIFLEGSTVPPVSTVPEPGTLSLLGLGGLGLVAGRLRRRKRAA